MKKYLLLGFASVACVCSAVAQDDYKGVDEQALAMTRETGVLNMPSSVMSVPAKAASVKAFVSANAGESYYVFPETRNRPIEMFDQIPEVWTKRTKEERSSFHAKAAAGEYYVFQLGIYAYGSDVDHVTYSAKGLPDLTCFNLEGVDNEGHAFTKRVDVKRGAVQALWFGLQIPEDATKAIAGTLTLKSDRAGSKKIRIQIDITDEKVAHNGFDDDRRLSRLEWLNSTKAEDEEVVKGYEPITVKEQTLSFLGREIELAATGLPKAIRSYFDAGNMHLTKTPQPVLAEEMQFVIEQSDGNRLTLQPGRIAFTHLSPAKVCWEVQHRSPLVRLTVKGELESEGLLKYAIAVEAEKNVDIRDIRLEIPMTKEKSAYLMGMGKEGGLRPDEYRWVWDENKSQDMVWVGGVNGGLSLKLKGSNYRKPLVNIYYQYGKLNMPTSWCNDHQGGCIVKTEGDHTLINAYSGKRTLQQGERQDYDFDICITPFKTIDRVKQFEKRYYHNSNDDLVENFIRNAEQSDAGIINIHHRKDIYPFINYPYFNSDVPYQKQFIDQAHAAGQKVCFYYTTRELTVNTPEIWAMRSLGGEIIYPGAGSTIKTVINPDGSNPWLLQHFKDDFIPAWVCTIKKGRHAGAQDLSVITTPDSRLDNFYIEGLDWMCKNIHLDGIYIDDTALGGYALRRARKVLDRNRDEAFINMHIWNNDCKMGAYGNGINQYMDLLPFIDHLWIGEGRSYDTPADYWLTEISGIPFGLPSQMLNGGGNRWRGMVFGMTNRAGWYGPNPTYMWKFWDANKIADMEMYGFWSGNAAVSTDNAKLYATVYQSADKAIIAVGNWSDGDESGRLRIDWNKLGMDRGSVKIYQPYIQEFQEETTVDPERPVTVKGKEGCIIVIEKR